MLSLPAGVVSMAKLMIGTIQILPWKLQEKQKETSLLSLGLTKVETFFFWLC